MLFTPEFEVMHESSIDDDDLTFEEGKKPQGSGFITDASISWRGDSNVFVVNYEVQSLGRKCLTWQLNPQFKVTKGPARADNQVVFSVSEKPLPYLKKAFAFMPNGSLVTGFQNRLLPNGKDYEPEIVFWERNGLRHGEFSLVKEGFVSAGQDIHVIWMGYNPDTTLLAVQLQVDKQDEQVLILCRSNWKWYVKQVFRLPEADDNNNIGASNESTNKKMCHVEWLSKQKLAVVSTSGCLYQLEYSFKYNSSMTNYNKGDDLAYTLAVNGSELMLTPLGKLLIPPPMSEK